MINEIKLPSGEELILVKPKNSKLLITNLLDPLGMVELSWYEAKVLAQTTSGLTGYEYGLITKERAEKEEKKMSNFKDYLDSLLQYI